MEVAIRKNAVKTDPARDFRPNILSFLVLAVGLFAGILWQSACDELACGPQAYSLALIVAVAGACVQLILPLWAAILFLEAVSWVAAVLVAADLGTDVLHLMLPLNLGVLISPCLQVARHWEKAVVLFLGRFRALQGPGVFFIVPLLDRVARFVDTRIQVSDFSAEKAITRDTVPVDVDALAFWMVWDARKAVLEVKDSLEAVSLSAKTALQNAVGQHNLSELLSAQDHLGKEIQQVLDRKTNPWGITILSVEIHDIMLPKELEDAMSRKAQAEREQQSRLILSETEIQVAQKYVEAGRVYRQEPQAARLRAVSMVVDAIRQNKAVLILPHDIISTLLPDAAEALKEKKA